MSLCPVPPSVSQCPSQRAQMSLTLSALRASSLLAEHQLSPSADACLTAQRSQVVWGILCRADNLGSPRSHVVFFFFYFPPRPEVVYQ